MNILCDLHHFDLYHSFELLFNPMGHRVFRPIGREWQDEGFWGLAHHPLVVDGYLSCQDGHCESSLSAHTEFTDPSWARYGFELLRVGSIINDGNGYFRVLDKSKGTYQNAITLSAFRSHKFDIIISSVPQHFPLFEKLRALYQPQAKHIFHMGPGNMEWEVPNGARNVMWHTSPRDYPDALHYVEYCQPFSLDTFKYKSPINHQTIWSYVHFPQSEDLMREVAHLAPELQLGFKARTLGPVSDIIVSTQELAQHIANSAFTWHYKPGGESYGHIIHNTYACGRPAIVNLRDYADKKAGLLLEDLVTCIDINRPVRDIAYHLRKLSDPVSHKQFCEKAYERFCDVVNFDNDRRLVEKFLGDLR